MQKTANNFSDAVRTVVRNIPQGRTMSYGEVATLAGNPRAARAVARLMSLNYDTDIPCHRVICANGAVGGYNKGGTSRKKEILLKEGVILK
jgi:O-6-methylguanine DNA methyltransferase